ncbi:MAG: hypothetical protein EHM64_10200, partial [Ignavibacteriae bacterium]
MQNLHTTKVSADAHRNEQAAENHGLRFERYFTRRGVHPFDEIEWEKRTATIANEKGEKIFEQQD